MACRCTPDGHELSVRMSEVTHLLEAAQHGDRQAAAALLPLVYDELRKLAAARMAALPPMMLRVTWSGCMPSARRRWR